MFSLKMVILPQCFYSWDGSRKSRTMGIKHRGKPMDGVHSKIPFFWPKDRWRTSLEMGVSWNGATPSLHPVLWDFMGFSLINHPFWDAPSSGTPPNLYDLNRWSSRDPAAESKGKPISRTPHWGCHCPLATLRCSILMRRCLLETLVLCLWAISWWGWKWAILKLAHVFESFWISMFHNFSNMGNLINQEGTESPAVWNVASRGSTGIVHLISGLENAWNDGKIWMMSYSFHIFSDRKLFHQLDLPSGKLT